MAHEHRVGHFRVQLHPPELSFGDISTQGTSYTNAIIMLINVRKEGGVVSIGNNSIYKVISKIRSE